MSAALAHLEITPVEATFLAGQEALDVSRITGIPYFFAKTETRGKRHPIIDLLQLDEWDRVRVTWALIAAYAFLHSLGYSLRQLEAERSVDYWGFSWR